jgi:hypothetical protein
MTRIELNMIIEIENKNPVLVSELAYPEVEELYLSCDWITKSEIGRFYQKYDYQGVRNALELANNIEIFKKQMIDNVTQEVYTDVSPSQYEYLTMLRWNVDRLNIKQSAPWTK